MTKTILQAYANLNLLDYESSDGGTKQFDYLIEAAADLSQTITNKNIVSFALAAINPRISVENTQLKELQENIQNKWPLFGKNTKSEDIQRTILRAVILNTLADLIDNDDKKAAIIWLSCQHLYKYIVYTNDKEKNIIEKLIKKAGKRYDNLAKKDFQIVAPKLDFNFSKTSSVRLPVNKSRSHHDIFTNLNNIPNLETTQHNTYYGKINTPSKENFKKWYEGFSSKLSKVLEELTTNEREAIKKYLISVDKEFVKIFETIAKEIPSQIENSLHSLSNNNNLIWWKETLYSKSLENSYRNVPIFIQVVAMAYDLTNELNGYTPISVDFFLKETFFKVQSKEKSITLDKVFEKVMAEKNVEYLSYILSQKELDSNSAWSLLDCLKNSFYENEINTDTFGIQNIQELTYSELLVWLFHDFQASKLAQNG